MQINQSIQIQKRSLTLWFNERPDIEGLQSHGVAMHRGRPVTLYEPKAEQITS